MPDTPLSDVALKDLTISQVESGDIETAKQTASKITDSTLGREAWLKILYTLCDKFQDLKAVKETILSLPSSDLWIGSWVHDLILFTARSGDIEGALTFVNKLPWSAPRGHFLFLIASVQTKEGDYHGAESTVSTLEPGNTWRDFTLLGVAREMISRGNTAEAHSVVARIVDPEVRDATRRFDTSPPTGQSS